MNSASIPRVVFGRVTISTGVNDVIRFYDGTANRTATLVAGSYYVRGDNVTTTGQGDLLYAIAYAMNNAPSTGITTFTATVANADGASQGKVTIAAGATFSLLWTDGSMSFSGASIGFETAADDTGAATYTSDNPCPTIWYPGIEAEYQPNRPKKVRTRSESVSGVVDVQRIRASLASGVAKIAPLVPSKVNSDDAAATAVVFEDFWEDAGDGGPFLYYPLYTSNTGPVHRIIDDAAWGDDFTTAAQLIEGYGGTVYGATIPMIAWVSPT